MASARTGHHRVQRVYFYYVNHLGNLYPLESAASLGGPLPFGPACVRGAPLDFVLSRIVPRPPDMETPPNLDPRFRWVSPCGRELNYVAAAATPIVFHTLEGTTLASRLAMNVRGELYHPHPAIGYALVKTHLAGQLGAQITSDSSGNLVFDHVHPIRRID